MKDRSKETKTSQSPVGKKSPTKRLLVPAQTDSNFHTSADHSELEEAEKKALEVPPNPADQPSNFAQRTKWTLIMIPSFLLVVAMGHFYITILVIALVIGML